MKIVPKSKSSLMKIINILLFVITFGKQKRFMTDFITTIGQTIYTPSNWDDLTIEQKDCIIFHENIHINQYLSDPWFFSIKYMLLPLPFGYAKYRLNYELEAFAQQIVYAYRKYDHPIFGPLQDRVVELMTGPDYFWTSFNKKDVRVKLLVLIFKYLRLTKPKVK